MAPATRCISRMPVSSSSLRRTATGPITDEFLVQLVDDVLVPFVELRPR